MDGCQPKGNSDCAGDEPEEFLKSGVRKIREGRYRLVVDVTITIRATACLVLLLASAGCRDDAPPLLVLATTTSVGHSGLLDALVPAFRVRTGITLRAHLVGSGQALRMLERGDVAVVISHAPKREAEFLARNAGWSYRKIMFNDFVIAGPPADPAGIGGARTATEAMARIARLDATFVSRGDSSGTHEREEDLWRAAAARPTGSRLIVAGQGMAGTLRVASQIGAYTLCDRATMVQLAPAVSVQILFGGDPALINTYAVILPRNASPAARRFAEWLCRGPGRDVIAGYRVRDAAAFTAWPSDRDGSRPFDLPR